MKKQLILLLLTAFFYVNAYSQIHFENGYLINNSGQKIDCLIKNMDWKNNPTEFKYKLSDNGELLDGSITSVKEFGFIEGAKFIRRIVKIDRSSDIPGKLSTEKSPNFVDEELFLKVLIEGKASLYFFADGEVERYFYSKDDVTIDQLVHKNYMVSEKKIAPNNQFRQQLWADLKCTTQDLSRIEKLQYIQKDLMGFVIDYNSCNNSGSTIYGPKARKDVFNLSIRPRLNNSSFDIFNDNPFWYTTTFKTKQGFGIGMELEYILPYNKNKWAILTEPTYQNYSAEAQSKSDYLVGGKLTANAVYNAIEFPVTLRHYLFLNSDSKIFVNASGLFDLSFNSTLKYKTSTNTPINSLKLKGNSTAALGIGYKAKDKYIIEVKYYTAKNLMGAYQGWGSRYQNLSLVVGYSFF